MVSLSYVVGVRFAICAFWIWVRYRAKTEETWFFVFVLLGGLVCLMHLYAFAIYAVCVSGYECSLLWERLRIERPLRVSQFRIRFAAAVTLIVPVLILWFSPISRSPELMVGGMNPPSGRTLSGTSKRLLRQYFSGPSLSGKSKRLFRQYFIAILFSRLRCCLSLVRYSSGRLQLER